MCFHDVFIYIMCLFLLCAYWHHVFKPCVYTRHYWVWLITYRNNWCSSVTLSTLLQPKDLDLALAWFNPKLRLSSSPGFNPSAKLIHPHPTTPSRQRYIFTVVNKTGKPNKLRVVFRMSKSIFNSRSSFPVGHFVVNKDLLPSGRIGVH